MNSDWVDLLNATDVASYKAGIVRFAHDIGFRTVDAMTVVDHEDGRVEFQFVENIDNADWTSLDPAYAKRDPVMQHLKRSSQPIIWGAGNYRDAGVRETYDVLASLGLHSGLSVASHLPDGRHFVLGVQADRDLSRCVSHMAQALPKLELFSVYALDAAFRLLLPPERQNVGELALREIEALRYGFDGWSGRMLADRFNMEEASCLEWLGRIAAKLDCRHFRQAALKAWRIGVFC